jgi:hypothetical protein
MLAPSDKRNAYKIHHVETLACYRNRMNMGIVFRWHSMESSGGLNTVLNIRIP